MKRSRLVGLASVLLVTCLASSASAMYHPTVGRWLSRDPAGYVDGMNAYAATFAPDSTDPYGLSSAPTGSSADDKAEEGECCCVDDEDNCEIKIELRWSTPPEAGWRAREVKTEGAPRLGRSSREPHTVLQRIFAVKAKAYAKVTLTHKQGKDVTGCHLHQDVHGKANWNNRTAVREQRHQDRRFGRKTEVTHKFSRKEPYLEWETLNDYNSNKPIATYHDIWYEDEARLRILTTAPGRYSDPFQYWFQAHVTVEEAPSVENWWGFEVKLKGWRKKAPASAGDVRVKPTGSLWKDKPRQGPKFGAANAP